MLPDRSLLKGQKLMKNAKVEKFQRRYAMHRTLYDTIYTVFENHPKSLIFQFWYFPPTFVQFKLTASLRLSTKNVNEARFARNFECDSKCYPMIHCRLFSDTFPGIFSASRIANSRRGLFLVSSFRKR